jgi:hypothetical protein
MVSFRVFGSGFFNGGGIFFDFSMDFGEECFEGTNFSGFKASINFGELSGKVFW